PTAAGEDSDLNQPAPGKTEFSSGAVINCVMFHDPQVSLRSRWRELYEFWLRAVADVRYWGSGRLAIHDSASGCSLGGAHRLDQSLRLFLGGHGICLGGGHLHSLRLCVL